MANTIRCPHCLQEIPIADAVDRTIQERLAGEKLRAIQDAQLLARQSIAAEIDDLRERLRDTTEKLGEARDLETQLRKDRRNLEDYQRELQVNLQRTLDEEREKIREETLRQADESHRLKEADQSKLIDDMRKQIAELKRKAEQGSTHIQGEVMEMELEELLRNHFPQDEIEPVPDASQGADLIHRVRDAQGQPCGTILWESKRTKNWNDAWLPKLKRDQAACRADLAAVFSAQLPKGTTTFGCIDGVWVTGRSCLQGLAAALRVGLIEVARMRRSLEGRHSKAEQLVEYLASTAFRLRIEGVVETYESLKEDLNAERRTHVRMWQKREAQLERAINGLTGIQGEIDGILGSFLPASTQLEPLALPAKSFEDATPF